MSISKQGIIKSTGVINPNLLPHTCIQDYGLGYMTTYSNGIIEVDNTVLFNGQPTIKINPSSSTTSSGGLNAYNNSVILSSEKTYCYSCYIKSTDTDTWVSNSLGHFQTVSGSTAHNRTILPYALSNVPINKWTLVMQTFQPSKECTFKSFFIYFANTSQTIWISNVKLEEGIVPTTWCPNKNDIISTNNFSLIENSEIDNCKFQKNGYWETNRLIEY